MSREPAVRYLPSDVVDALRRWTPDLLDDSALWELHRIVERAYAVGYDDGHRRGSDEERHARAQPNINDLNAIREELRERAEGAP